MLSLDIIGQRGELTIRAALQLTPGKITALCGPSGAGKSSLIAMIAGLLKPEDGYIGTEEEDFFNQEEYLHIAPHRRGLGVVFQDARLLPHLNVARNMTFGWRRRGKPLPPDAMADLIDALDINHLMSRKPHQLSGGEARRVAIGRAVAGKPIALLLDEPFTGLDAERRERVADYLLRIRDEWQLPMLLVSHRAEDVARLSDRVLTMEKGVVQGANSQTAAIALAQEDDLDL
ncbi:MAG: ATP-binding cassette domain-containing protein [Pseudomonadota bacterium]